MKLNYHREAVSSCRWRGEDATDGCRDDVVKRVAVSSVEEPNARDASVTNPAEEEAVRVRLQRHSFLISCEASLRVLTYW